MNIICNSRVLAENYRPDSPPPRWITHHWLVLSGSALTSGQLQAALMTGQPCELAPGMWLEWSVKDEL